MPFELFTRPEVIKIDDYGNIIITQKILTDYNLTNYQKVHLYCDYKGYGSWHNVVGIVFDNEENNCSYSITEDSLDNTKFNIRAVDFLKYYGPFSSTEYKFAFTTFEDKPMLSFTKNGCLPNG